MEGWDAESGLERSYHTAENMWLCRYLLTTLDR